MQDDDHIQRIAEIQERIAGIEQSIDRTLTESKTPERKPKMRTPTFWEFCCGIAVLALVVILAVYLL